MQFFMSFFVGLLVSISVSAEPLLEGRVRLSSGQPVANAQVRLFDLTNLHQSVGTTTDETGHFALSLPAAAPGSALPQGFALGQNYPNPFNPSTIIPYQIPTAAHVRLEVFNLLGQRLATLVDAEQAAGAHTATWTATDATGRAVGAGVYIYRLVSGSATVSRRMVLIDGQAGTPAAGAASVLPGGSGDGAGEQTYGLVVAGPSIAPYVVRDFRVEAGMAPVEVVVEVHPAGKALGDDLSDLFDLFNTQQEEASGPDLIVQSPSVSDSTLTPGQAFTLSATVQNQGDQPAAATTVRYYRSNNATITASDTQIGTNAVGELTASATQADSLALTAPTPAFTYFYGACVDPVADESNTDNNCSTAATVTVKASTATWVTIPDPNLRLIIEAQLRKRRGSAISKAEMETLEIMGFLPSGNSSLYGLTMDEYLSIRNSGGIKNLTGIEHATNLTHLQLSLDLSMADLSPLASLSRLSWLHLGYSNISDLSPLVGLQLWRAYFNNNKISDIAPLLKILKDDADEVDVSGNPLSPISNTYIRELRDRGITVYADQPVSLVPQIYNDNVFVLPVTENLALSLSKSALPLKDYAVRFYEHFSDQFDFLIFLPNLFHSQVGSEPGPDFYSSVYNDVKGIGLGPYFDSTYGSAKKLQGVIFFRVVLNNFDSSRHHIKDFIPHRRSSLVKGPFLHEVMHRWANYIIEPKFHWTANSANGILGGFDIATLVDYGDGRYSANGSVPGYDGFSNGGWRGNFIPYSPIELYLAGLIPPEEVPDLWVAEDSKPVLDKDGFWDRKSFTTNRVKTYTIEDIIAEHGPRIPDHTQSQKNFRAAVILLISEDYPAHTGMLDILSEDVSIMSHTGYDQNDEFYNFYEATGGRATITMDGLSSLKRQGAAKRLVPSSYGTPPAPIVDCYHGDGLSHTPKKEK